MEDRTEPGLWLELVSSSEPDYSGRASELVERSGVSSAWWGRNANPNRTDLPRTIAEFDTLGLYETSLEFVPATTPVGITGHHFVRTQRPGQGVITGEPTTGIFLVLISPRSPEAARALRDWADFVHIRHIAESAVPGFAMITPYENSTGGDPLYLHLYEMTTEDPESTFQLMRPRVERLLGSPGTTKFDDWAWHRELRIVYVNTFAREGVIPPRSAARPAS
jgi:hypothetical protein